MQPNEAPERIWAWRLVIQPHKTASPSAILHRWQGSAGGPGEGKTEYVRAARITALEAEVARLRGLVEQAEYQLGGENNAVRRRWADWRETARHALAQGEQP